MSNQRLRRTHQTLLWEFRLLRCIKLYLSFCSFLLSLPVCLSVMKEHLQTSHKRSYLLSLFRIASCLCLKVVFPSGLYKGLCLQCGKGRRQRFRGKWGRCAKEKQIEVTRGVAEKVRKEGIRRKKMQVVRLGPSGTPGAKRFLLSLVLVGTKGKGERAGCRPQGDLTQSLNQSL